jgi:hypothetical protein
MERTAKSGLLAASIFAFVGPSRMTVKFNNSLSEGCR